MEKSIELKIDIGKYKYVDLGLNEACNIIELAIEKRGETEDLLEALRYIRNFDEFYSFMKKKFKDFITPPKSSKDLILGRVVIDKIKLYKINDERRVVIVFDRRVDLDFIKELLENIGYKRIKISKQVF